MPLVFCDGIEEHDMRSHPEWYFLSGDNEQRRGRGGQAGVGRGHPNAIEVATKRALRRTDDAYWSDREDQRLIAVIDTERAPAFAHVGNGGTVVCPSAGLGTGLSELPTRARRVFAYLRQQIAALERLHPEDSPATAC